MDKTQQPTVLELHEDLQHFYALATQAIRDNDMEAHFVHGGQFHRTATAILERTGIDPRERYQ